MARMTKSDILPILEALCDTALGVYVQDREERSGARKFIELYNSQ